MVENVSSEIYSIIHSIVKDIWINDIRDDYKKDRLRLEGSFQCSMYYHLRRKIGEQFLEENNLSIYAEYSYLGKKVDLAIVFNNRGTSEPVALFELKYKNSTIDTTFQKDVKKVFRYIEQEPKGAKWKHYLCFIQEAEFEEMTDDFSWISKELVSLTKGRTVELTGGLYKASEEKDYWIIVEH
ncbi:hypothetical protein ACQCN2_03565 [Brevibacillus ginsengisoli]|uniref:hypothetical protein n=1 Tax=Brevibacillus ginsengisoli TaxID=363854 RepID=UPI003CF247E5